MENASKALIIAGAILLSILLISLGIMVYTNAKGTIGNTNLDSEEIQTFNTKISQYCGKNKSAEDMNALMSAISSSNGAQSKVADKHLIGFELKVKENGTNCNYYSVETIVNVVTDDNGKKLKGGDVYLNKDKIGYPTFLGGITFNATYNTDENGYIDKVTITFNNKNKAGA